MRWCTKKCWTKNWGLFTLWIYLLYSHQAGRTLVNVYGKRRRGFWSKYMQCHLKIVWSWRNATEWFVHVAFLSSPPNEVVFALGSEATRGGISLVKIQSLFIRKKKKRLNILRSKAACHDPEMIRRSVKPWEALNFTFP